MKPGPKQGMYKFQRRDSAQPNATGPRYRTGAPTAPKSLSKEARKVWKFVVSEMSTAGVLAHIDLHLLAAFCVCAADIDALTDRLNRDGLVIDVPRLDGHGRPTDMTIPKPHPAVKLRAEAMVRLQSLARELGFSPAARSRAGAAAEPEKELTGVHLFKAVLSQGKPNGR